MSKVLVGVTGGIAAYKALDVISALRKKGVEVKVMMTKNAAEFVSPLTFQSLCQNTVSVDMFEKISSYDIEHISLAHYPDVIAIIPATANVIGKVANGIADDLLSTVIMASDKKVIFAPAMNCNMYANPIVQNNIKKLKEYGYSFIEPQEGRLACGDIGMGKLQDTEVITDMIMSAIHPVKDLIGKKVLVTAGPTISKIDPVRFLSNHSSGKMGYEIARIARDRGADVTLISGPVSLKPVNNVEFIGVKTNQEMYDAVMERFDDVDIVIKAAAVADYKIEEYSQNKIKKNDSSLDLKFVKDNDILKTLGERKKNQILIGFAAESNDIIDNAKKKIEKKNLDFIVANDITSSDTGFKSDYNKVTIIDKDGNIYPLDKMSKAEVAENIFNLL